jgi:hypothetical protein
MTFLLSLNTKSPSLAMGHTVMIVIACLSRRDICLRTLFTDAFNLVLFGQKKRERGRYQSSHLYKSINKIIILYVITYRGLARLIIVNSRFDDWIYWTSLFQLELFITAHTSNSSLITNLSLHFFWISDWSLVFSLLHLRIYGSELNIIIIIIIYLFI